jgi:hypothetical protein
MSAKNFLTFDSSFAMVLPRKECESSSTRRLVCRFFYFRFLARNANLLIGERFASQARGRMHARADVLPPRGPRRELSFKLEFDLS